MAVLTSARVGAKAAFTWPAPVGAAKATPIQRPSVPPALAWAGILAEVVRVTGITGTSSSVAAVPFSAVTVMSFTASTFTLVRAPLGSDAVICVAARAVMGSIPNTMHRVRSTAVSFLFMKKASFVVLSLL